MKMKLNNTLFLILVCSFYSLSFINAQSIDLTKGHWVTKEIVLTDGKDKREVFYKRNSPDNIMDFSNISFVFNPDGTIGGNDIYGRESKPYGWRLIGNRLITDHGEWLNFQVLNDNEIRHTEAYVQIIENPFKFYEFTLERLTDVQTEDIQTLPKVKLSPMPVSCYENLNISWGIPGSVDIEIFDLNGKMVKGEVKIGFYNESSFTMTGIPSGNFILKVTLLNNKEIIVNETIQVICN